MINGLTRQVARTFNLGIVVCVGLLIGLGWPKDLAAQEPIRVAYCADCYPFQFRDEAGEPAGMFIDQWRLWSRNNQVSIEFKAGSWEKSLEMVRVGNADAHAGLTYNSDREQFLDFGAYLGRSDTRIFLHRSLPPITGLEELSAYRIGFIAGDPVKEFLQRRFPTANIIPYNDYDSILSELENGRLKVFAADTLTGIHFLGERGMASDFSYPESNLLFQSEWFLAIAKGRPDLLARVNSGMAEISPKETQEISDKWLGNRGQSGKDALRVAIDWNYPPFAFLNDKGEPDGLLVDYWLLLSEKTSRPVEFLSSRHKDTLAAVRDGGADVQAGLSDAPSDNKWLGFSSPILDIPSNLFFQPSFGEVTGVGDFIGRRVGVIGGSYQEAYLLERYPDVEIVGFESVDQVLSNLLVGAIDAYLGEEPTAEAIARRLGIYASLTRLPDSLFTREIRAGFLSGRDDLATNINQGMSAISDEEIVDIVERWIPGFMTPEVATTVGNIELTNEERVWITANPRIRVHNETDWPPFNFARDGEPQGYSIDYMNMLAERVGLEIEYVTGPSWNEFLRMMKDGTLDVMLNIVKTTERQEYLLYTPSYADNPNTILSRRDESYDSLQQLFGKTVSVPKGFFYEEILKRDFPQIKLHLATSTLESMKAVSFGKADAALGELAVFNHLLDEHLMTGLIVSGEVKMGDPELSLLNMATRKDLPILASILSKAVSSVTVEERREIQQKWIGAKRPDSEPVATVPLSESEKSWLAAHPNIRLGIDPDYPPFEFLSDEGEYTGIGADYVNLINERLGTTMKPVPGLSWAEVVAGAKANTVDVLPVVTPNEKRAEYLNFTQTYIKHQVVIITRDGHPFISGPQDLKGETFAVIKNYNSSRKIMEQYPELNFEEFKTPLESLKAVAEGKATGTAINLTVATYLISKHNLSNLKLAAPMTMNTPGHAFGVRKDWPELVVILNKALASITPEEESAIRARWVSLKYETVVDRSEIIRVGLQVGGVALVIVVIIMIWNRRLQLATTEARNAQLAQRASEARMRGFLDYASTIVVIKDTDLRYILVNQAFAEERGQKEEDLIGKTVFDVHAPDVAEAMQRTDLEVLEKGEPIELEERILRPDGEWRDYLSVKYPVYDETGEIVALGTIASDITETKRAQVSLEESEALIKAFLDNANAMMFVKGDDRRYLLVNKAFADFRGYEPEYMAGKKPKELYEEEYAAEYDASDLQVIETGVSIVRETQAMGANGEMRDFVVNKFPVTSPNGRFIALGAVLNDITEHKETERALEEARDAAERVAESKSDFLAVVSHEVRTPMNGVLGMARLLVDTKLNRQQTEFAETIVHSSESLLGILNDLLDISKLEAGKLEIEDIPFNPVRAVSDSVAVMAARAKEKGLALNYEVAADLPDAVVGDPHRTRQVLLNLISNGIKFTETGSVSVELGMAHQDSDTAEIVLSVTDTGIGIPPRTQEKLFSSYTQGSVEVARKYGGTGLGLAICRRLAELMGGGLTIESAVGKGSCFTLRVPMRIATADEIAANEKSDIRNGEEVPNVEPMRVLMVEDNLVNQRVGAAMLEKAGHHMDLAKNGAEALRMFVDSEYDIVLMDRHMPVMDGIEATQKIREMSDRGADVPIIGVTAAANKSEIYECLDAGMDDIIIKPIDPDELAIAMAAMQSGEKSRNKGQIHEKSKEGTSAMPEEEQVTIDPERIETLRESYGEELATSLVDDFRRVAAEAVPRIVAVAKDGAWADLKREAHGLKGSSMTLGLSALSAHCRSIELACIDEDWETAVKGAETLSAKFDKAIAALDEISPVQS